MKKILITGSSGMIGTGLCQRLIKEGYEITGIDKVEPQEKLQMTFYQYDLKLYPYLLLNNKFDIIIHLAANARVLKSVLNPTLALENYLINHNIFEYARINKIPKFLFASSREVYGNSLSLPVSEDNASHRKTKSPYTASKMLGESLCYAYQECYNLDTKIVRFSNVYGKYDTSDRFVPKAINIIKKNDTFEIWGEHKILDFTYLDDCVNGLLVILKKWKKCPTEINVASGTQNMLADTAEIIKRLLHSKSKIKICKSPKGEVECYQADISKMKKLNWQPKIFLEEGLKKSIQYYWIK